MASPRSGVEASEFENLACCMAGSWPVTSARPVCAIALDSVATQRRGGNRIEQHAFDGRMRSRTLSKRQWPLWSRMPIFDTLCRHRFREGPTGLVYATALLRPYPSLYSRTWGLSCLFGSGPLKHANRVCGSCPGSSLFLRLKLAACSASNRPAAFSFHPLDLRHRPMPRTKSLSVSRRRNRTAAAPGRAAARAREEARPCRHRQGRSSLRDHAARIARRRGRRPSRPAKRRSGSPQVRAAGRRRITRSRDEK